MKKYYKESIRQGVCYIPFKHFHRGFETPLGGLDVAFLGNFTKLRNATVSFDMSVCPSEWNNSDPNTLIYMEVHISAFSVNVDKIQVSLKSDKNNGYFT
jgi:hypothetical protein